jgi:hypothetical protein
MLIKTVPRAMPTGDSKFAASPVPGIADDQTTADANIGPPNRHAQLDVIDLNSAGFVVIITVCLFCGISIDSR